MKVYINGNANEVTAQTVTELLQAKKLNFARVVIEHNGKILPQDLWEKTQIKNEDVFEIVSFVGGG